MKNLYFTASSEIAIRWTEILLQEESNLTLLVVHTYKLDAFQYFLIKLGIQPPMHLLKISIFSLNHVIFRPTKIMNNLLKDCRINTFKVIFQHQKSTESFWIFFSVKNIWLGDQLLVIFLKTSTLKVHTLFSKNVPNFCWLCSYF